MRNLDILTDDKVKKKKVVTTLTRIGNGVNMNWQRSKKRTGDSMKLIGYVLSKIVSYVCGLFLGIVSFENDMEHALKQAMIGNCLSRQGDSFQLVKVSGIKAGKYISYNV